MRPEREHRFHNGWRVAATALLVAAGYYVGANLGLILRIPASTPSAIWPPNSILTATLLLAPKRRWWIYLLAALPAHLAAEWSTVSPHTLMFAFFATNCSEAVLAALCVRAFSDAPARLDTLRRVVVFLLGAAVVAPFLSSFLDAAAVHSLRGEPYWVVWRLRLFSNLLSELTVATTILTVACVLKEGTGPLSLRRRVEAAILAITLVSVAVLEFSAAQGRFEIPGVPRWPVAALLPFLLWAAVRFGPPGASLSVLTTTLAAIWATTRSSSSAWVAGADTAIALQIFLSAIAVPLMCLAALIQERVRVQHALAERLRFEEFLGPLLAAFVHLPSHLIDDAIGLSLQQLGQFLQVDRVLLLQFSAENSHLDISHSWAARGFDAWPTLDPSHNAPSALERLLQEMPLVLSRSRDAASARTDVASSVTIPLVATTRVLGGLALESITAERTWPEEMVQRLRPVAEAFANALSRKEAEDALRASEGMKSAILASLSSGVAVLDRAGHVIAVSDSWTRLGKDPRTAPVAGAGVGADYLELCRQAAGRGVGHAVAILAGAGEVLAGTRSAFSFEYAPAASPLERWFALSVVPLNRPEGGAVVSHTDVTERKHAEVQAQQSRQQLAHFARVSTMGELAASLAHELRQPLTGIMTNAQAARRFLDGSPPDLEEVRGALGDIVADDRRAAEIIERLRGMLRKDEARQDPVDFHDLIGNVTGLLGNDAIIRGVRVALDLAPAPVIVQGDRIQLEQVIVNLVLNAMEAMSEVPAEQRRVVVRTHVNDGGPVQVDVEDAGTGLPDGDPEKVFEPFYTTKPTGMGVGLSIARSIIEAHGGAIWGANNAGRGATFYFSLPRAVEATA